jgi:diphthamide synthase (EF-2-diphthine--ammonia ligase)
VDPCGENGEYHSLVTRAPGFGQGVDLGRWSRAERPPYAYLVPGELALRPL